MKKLLLTGVALTALLNGSAAAADLRARQAYKAPPLVEAAYNWSGFYVGVHAGYGIADAQGVWDSAGAVHQWSRNDLRGGLWGAQVRLQRPARHVRVGRRGRLLLGPVVERRRRRRSRPPNCPLEGFRNRARTRGHRGAKLAVLRNRRIRLGQCARHHGERGQSSPRAQRGRNSLWRRRRGRLRRRLVAQGRIPSPRLRRIRRISR